MTNKRDSPKVENKKESKEINDKNPKKSSIIKNKDTRPIKNSRKRITSDYKMNGMGVVLELYSQAIIKLENKFKSENEKAKLELEQTIPEQLLEKQASTEKHLNDIK